MTSSSNVSIQYDDLSREQAIELLKVHNADDIQRNQLIKVLLEKLNSKDLSEQQRFDIAMFELGISQLDFRISDAARKIIGLKNTIN